MKPMASKTRRPRTWNWAVGLTIVLGPTLVFPLCYRAMRKDVKTEGQAAYDRGEWSRAAELARERLKSDGNDLRGSTVAGAFVDQDGSRWRRSLDLR